MSKYRAVFEDTYGLFRFYFGLLDAAERGEFEFDDPERLSNGDGPHEVIKFIEYVRDTWCFTLDSVLPFWFNPPFSMVSVFEEMLNQSPLYYGMVEGAKVAIEEINAEMAHTGKKYEFVDVTHCMITRNRLFLLTITAKEVTAGAVDIKTIEAIVLNSDDKSLEQWRFKPPRDDPMMID